MLPFLFCTTTGLSVSLGSQASSSDHDMWDSVRVSHKLCHIFALPLPGVPGLGFVEHFDFRVNPFLTIVPGVCIFPYIVTGTSGPYHVIFYEFKGPLQSLSSAVLHSFMRQDG